MEIYLGVIDEALREYLLLTFSEKGLNVYPVIQGEKLKENSTIILDVEMAKNVVFQPLSDMSNIIIIDYDEELDKLYIPNYHKRLQRPFTIDELNNLVFQNNDLKSIPTPLSVSLMDKLIIDDKLRIISLNNESVKLSKRQFSLFMYLYKNKERICSRQELFENVWKDESNDVYVVDTYVCYLKKRIESSLRYPNIKNIRNQGYMLY